MARKNAQETLEALYPKSEDRFTPRSPEEAVRYVAGAKKPPKKNRESYEQRRHMSEAIAPLYTKPVGEVPPADAGSKWSEARDEHLFAFLIQGGIIRVWLDLAGLTYNDIYQRKKKDQAFSARYEEARSQGMDALADEALVIASTPMACEEVAETVLSDGKTVTVRKKGDNTYARKLAFYARVELLKKWAPERYGEKLSVDVNDKRAAGILAARRRLQGLE